MYLTKKDLKSIQTEIDSLYHNTDGSQDVKSFTERRNDITAIWKKVVDEKAGRRKLNYKNSRYSIKRKRK